MLTSIHTFITLPQKHKDSVQAIHKFYQEVMKHQPGYISARLFSNDDAEKITVISLWSNQQDFAATKQFLDLSTLPHLIVDCEFHIYKNFVEIPGTSHIHRLR